MIDGSVIGTFLSETCARRTPVRPIHRLGKQQVVMAAKIDVGFFARQEEEVAIGMAAACLVVVAQILESQAPVIFRMAVAMEVVEHDYIHTEIANGGYPWRLHVKAAGVHELLGEGRMEVRGHHLITGEWA